MEKVPYDFPGFVIGTGFMHAGSTRKYLRARILAVRGELTRDHIAGLPKDIILGDPGLLMPILMPKKEQKRFTLGVIPHYIDKKDEGIKKFCRRYKKEVRLIDIQQPPLKVVKDVDECEFILSSSLHGLVFADSLGIPNVWTILSDKVSGKGFKFQDYNSALKKEQFPMQFTGEEKLSDIIASTCLPSRQLVVEKSQALEAAFRQFKDEAGPNRG
ncbi:MAG TPA: polysaccharide pyruvyl transferase family protein [Anaerolineales bacterium]|nr:polysaccharide pyruvyl transferase family protein [Anaerolineales bacterium]